MSYNWKEESGKDGGSRAEPLPNGVHDVEIIRLVYARKDGTVFQSRSGDPQMMIIFADEHGREASLMVTLSFKAAFILAKVLDAAGANLQAMQADNITPADFADEKFATANLVGRQLRIEVERRTGGNGQEYANVIPIQKNEPAPAAAEDDIPI